MYTPSCKDGGPFPRQSATTLRSASTLTHQTPIRGFRSLGLRSLPPGKRKHETPPKIMAYGYAPCSHLAALFSTQAPHTPWQRDDRTGQ